MIILDLDGCCANFADAAAAVHGKWGTKIDKWNFFTNWGLDEKKFWAKITEMGDDFYRDMVLPYPWTEELLNLVNEADDFIIMSSPACNTPVGYAAKKIWVDKYLQPLLVDPIKLIVGSEKQLLAGVDRLLIDDSDDNIKKFREAKPICGYAVTFPQLWNRQAKAGSGSLTFLKGYLKHWKVVRIDEEHNKRQNKIARSLWPESDSPGN